MTLALSSRISTNPKIRGGKPCIAGRRIAIQDIAIWHEWMGKSVEEIASDYDLSLTDIHLALAYYFSNREAIDQSIRQGETFAEEMRKKIPSKLKTKLAAHASQVLHG